MSVNADSALKKVVAIGAPQKTISQPARVIGLRFRSSFALGAGPFFIQRYFRVLLLVCGACASASGDSGKLEWPARLVTKPFHVGDNENKEMTNPRPDGSKFSGAFLLPVALKPTLTTFVYVAIRVGGMAPGNDKRYAENFRKGELLSRLFVNGNEVAVLNKLIHGRDSVANIQTIQIRVNGPLLIEGRNELEIRPGANGRNLDDFELHEVTVSSSQQ